MRQWGEGRGFACGLYKHTFTCAHSYPNTDSISFYVVHVYIYIHSRIIEYLPYSRHPHGWWVEMLLISRELRAPHRPCSMSFRSRVFYAFFTCVLQPTPYLSTLGGVMKTGFNPPSLGWPCSLLPLVRWSVSTQTMPLAFVPSELSLDSSAAPLRPRMPQYAAYGRLGT